MVNNFPIVLSHGIARFDFLTNSIFKALNHIFCDISFESDKWHYFKGIKSHLRRNNIEIYSSNVGFADNLEIRAKELRKEILRILDVSKCEKVHIIAHSMGGLDSRFMINHYPDIEEKIFSLTTIGTPHLGTSFAQWGLSKGGAEIIKSLEKWINLNGFWDLTIKECEKFNSKYEKHEASNKVLYQTYACHQIKERVFFPCNKSWEIIFKLEGENDGLVSVHSQKWQSILKGHNGIDKKIFQYSFPVLADHLNEVGWWNIFQMRKLKWWQRNVLKEKKDFEEKIKDIYLIIAKNILSL